MEEELVSVMPGKRAFQAESTASAKAPREDLAWGVRRTARLEHWNTVSRGREDRRGGN